ncbi:helix-turn-helix transcriptional regulator [Paracoccus broussonetiae]|uniref:helix-turn-helix transcriptional regulator n=1 Tax=Paracoccus broussonetiae TaxID=3075834 RepID=UPI00288C0BAD|nr:response regulator transcription factor [Paracoccus sp. CPCC 101403]
MAPPPLPERSVMMIPSRNDLPALVPEVSLPVVEVVFVGNHCNFSGCLISATVQELGGVSSATLSSFPKFKEFVQTTGALPEVLLLDEPLMRSMTPAEWTWVLSLPGLRLGIAYSTMEFALACHADPALRRHSVNLLPLNVRLDVWLSIVKLIVHGGSYVCPEVIAALPHEERTEAVGVSGLTQRQLDVLQQVADGHSNKSIAKNLGLSIHTVKLHLHNGSIRLGARNRTEAAMRFREMRP